jgi:aryl-alcohol dehydrogenase-like predicted oxidoreductase
VHPLTALQTEYSLWSRNAEIAVLDACKELGIAFVAFSPLARAFLTGKLTDPKTQFEGVDIRVHFPRFSAEHYPRNLQLLQGYKAIADEVGCSMAQLAIAWTLHKDTHIIPIPGTRHLAYAQENFGAINVKLNADQMTRLAQMVGIGRGADLVTYATTLILFLTVVAAIMRERRSNEVLTQLVRRLAIQQARFPEGEDGRG